MRRRSTSADRGERAATYFGDRLGLWTRSWQDGWRPVRAVDDVDIQIRRGETLAWSASPAQARRRSAATILRLEEPTGGKIRIDGQDITRLPQSTLRPMRARMQMIFQDPISSLSPRMKVSGMILSRFRIHHVPVDEKRKVAELLEMVGLAVGTGRQVPAPTLGRAGAARAASPGVGAQPRLTGGRRADSGAGCVGGGRHPEPVGRPARASEPDVPDHHPQPEHHHLHRVCPVDAQERHPFRHDLQPGWLARVAT